MSKQRVVLSLILVNGKRELLGVEDIEIPSRYIKTMERDGQRLVTHTLKKLVEACEAEIKPPPLPHHD